jgi:hypothetical protein
MTDYEAQQDRVAQIAKRAFPGCSVVFGVQGRPCAMSLWILDPSGNMLCELPGETDIAEVKQMSDELIERRLRELATQKP